MSRNHATLTNKSLKIPSIQFPLRISSNTNLIIGLQFFNSPVAPFPLVLSTNLEERLALRNPNTRERINGKEYRSLLKDQEVKDQKYIEPLFRPVPAT